MKRKPAILVFSAVSIAVLAGGWCLPRDVAETKFAPEWLRNQIRHASSQAYHKFADQRPFAGIPNFANVVSNLPFLILGMWGIWIIAKPLRGSVPRPRAVEQSAEVWAYAVFFLGITLTCFGSAYYHWAPSSGTLLWDRLPMSIAFMGVLAATIGDRISPRAGAAALVPLVALGAGSVLYWHVTEARGAPDLRLYGIVQFYPLMAIPLLLVLFRSRYTHSLYLLAACGFYVLAKVFEGLDHRLLLLSGISGHSLKHLAAAAAPLSIAMMLSRRAPAEPPQ